MLHGDLGPRNQLRHGHRQLPTCSRRSPASAIKAAAATFFESEFIAALKLIDQGVPRWRLKGSWAGATGYPQFMPSVALRLRADGDGDGYADIWSNEVDGLASIANYLRDAGWKPNVPWGVPVRMPATLNRAAIRRRLDRAALPAGLSPPQPLADGARMARARRRAGRPRACPTARWRRLIEPDGA